tara:strand:+ start:513 stop:656 length:144 start_codon:yes stop_codon:yes gene_type:complete
VKLCGIACADENGEEGENGGKGEGGSGKLKQNKKRTNLIFKYIPYIS